MIFFKSLGHFECVSPHDQFLASVRRWHLFEKEFYILVYKKKSNFSSPSLHEVFGLSNHPYFQNIKSFYSLKARDNLLMRRASIKTKKTFL